MNKTELIAAMAETSNLSKKDCEAALTAFITATENALKAGDKVQLVGFGIFEVKERAARIGRMEMSRNVQSGNTQNLKSSAALDQAAVCACAHSRYFTGGSPSGLRV